MAKLIYQLPSDDQAKLITPTLVAGTLKAGYTLANLSNDVPGIPVKFTGTSARIVWDLTAFPSLIELVVLYPGNIDGTVTWETNTVNNWAPADVITAFTLPAVAGGRRRYPFLDCRLTGFSQRYVSLYITGNSSPIVLEGIWFSEAIREVTHNPSWGVTTPRGEESLTHTTNFGVEQSTSRGTIGGITGSIGTTVAGVTALQAWHAECQYGRTPSIVIFDPAINDAQLVAWDQPTVAPAWQAAQHLIVPVALKDIARGERWFD